MCLAVHHGQAFRSRGGAVQSFLVRSALGYALGVGDFGEVNKSHLFHKTIGIGLGKIDLVDALELGQGG